MVKVLFQSTSLDMPNPERGWYGTGSTSAPWFYMRDWTPAGLTALFDRGIRLVIGVPLLDATARQLPDAWLKALDSEFAMCRSAGLKVIVRPAYNYNSSGRDAPIDIALAHVAQLGQVFKANADAIFALQAGMIGAWGEWHSSVNGLDSVRNKAALFEAMARSWPAEHFIHVRYPRDVKALGWPARAGLHIDCMMADDSDGGTFKRGLNDPLRAEVAAQTEVRPFGGESCKYSQATSRKAGEQFIAYGRRNHIAYLNANYDRRFMEQWRREGRYDEISRSIGYRFQLDEIQHPATAVFGSRPLFDVALRNVGWARVFTPRQLVVTLRNVASGASVDGRAGDMNQLPAQATTSTLVTVPVNIPPDTPEGEYTVHLSCPDAYKSLATDVRYAIRFANSSDDIQRWDAATAMFGTGSCVTVRREA